MHHNDASPNIPIGNEFLLTVRNQEIRCEETYGQSIEKEGGVRAPQTFECLGTALSLMDRLASCWWGCANADHSREYIVGRGLSNARAAYALLKTGFYDEAFGLIRQLGETGNLVLLFTCTKSSFPEWVASTDSERRTRFTPVSVRKQLENLTEFLPIDQGKYQLLSGLSTHITPNTIPQGQNIFAVPTLGGYFQKDGALVAINELSGMVGWMLWLGSMFIGPPIDLKLFTDASVALFRSIGGINLSTVEEYRVKAQQSPDYKEARKALVQFQALIRESKESNDPSPEPRDENQDRVDQ